jgi:hypothetical protein
MALSWWHRFLKTRYRPASRRGRFRPHFEALEARDVPTTFTVSNSNDSGAGSLRQAILDANADGNAGQVDLIQFNLPLVVNTGSALPIQLTSPLPVINHPVEIDGFSQNLAHPNTDDRGDTGERVVRLDGLAAGPNADGLVLAADNSIIRGMLIDRFGGAGVIVRGNNDLVAGNGIGTDALGTGALGNGTGVLVAGTNDRIGTSDLGDRNLISANGTGIVVQGATGARIQNNFIGTDSSADKALGNNLVGVDVVSGNQTLIGGAGTNEGNRISANGAFTHSSGVRISAANTTVQGNDIGEKLDPSSNLDGLGNGLDGIEVRASNVLIGGPDSGQGNRIFFNGGSGVAVEGAVSGVQILSNSISLNGALDIDRGVNGPPAPVLTAVTVVPNAVVITGKLNSRPNTLYRIEIFASTVSGPGATGDGANLLGFVTAQTDAQGNATFSFTQPAPGVTPATVASGLLLTATATDPGGDTSEFARPAGVGFVLPPDPPPAAPAPAARGIVATLQRAGKKKVLQVVVRFADTGAVKAVFRSPFQHPRFQRIRVTTVSGKGDGIADTVVLSALRNGKKKIRLIPA